MIIIEKDFTQAERNKAAKSGNAMPDGSYPINNVADLHNAIQAIGRASNPAAVKAHIKTRAKVLDATSVIPDTWESARVIVGNSEQLSEAAYDASSGKLTLTVIKPGWSKNSRYYSESLLKKHAKIFEGAKMFTDHATDKEAQARPEGSVKDWVASVGKVWPDSSGKLLAEATVIDPAFKTKLDTLNKAGLLNQMGVSIRVLGEAVDGERDGRKGKIIESFLHCRSVDFVTFAGAGGQVEALESAGDQDDVDLIDEAQLRTRRPDLVELIESKGAQTMDKTITIQELREAWAMSASDHDAKADKHQATADKLKAGDEKDAHQAAADAHSDAADSIRDANKKSAMADCHNQESGLPEGEAVMDSKLMKENQQLKAQIAAQETAAKKTAAQTELAKMIAEAKLPEVAANRIKEQFKEAVDDKGMKEAIVAEAAYIQSLKTVTKHNGPTDNGDSKVFSEADGSKVKKALKENFMVLGMSEKEAEIASA